MRVALMGGVSSSYCALRALIDAGVTITGVLGLDESRAEKVSDYRSLRSLAQEAGLPFLSFVKVSEPEVESFLRDASPDLFFVIGLSQLVPDALINVARHGGVGFHPTMLPKGRGRAPVAWTILLGGRAAVSLFYLVDEPDAGDLLAQREVPVLPDDYSEDLIARTNDVLADVVKELAPRIIAGDLPRIPQDHSQATFYEKRTPADGLIDWTRSTDDIYRLVRAAGRPYPGAFGYLPDGRKVTIWRACPADPKQAIDTTARPGTVLASTGGDNTLIRTGDGAILATEMEGDDGQTLAGLSPGVQLVMSSD